MAREKEDPSLFTQTQIDLGEDLLEATQQIVIPKQKPDLSQNSVQDRLNSAKILLGEGLLDDAKKLLRKILIEDSHHVAAKKFLEEIQRQELQQIFEIEPHKRFASAEDQTRSEQLRWSDPSEIIRSLEADLHLGLAPALPSLFDSDPEDDKWKLKVADHLEELSPQDHMDIGVAFLEMGFYQLASSEFRKTIKKSSDFRLSASSLLAYSEILGGQPFQATMVLEPLLNDEEISEIQKLDLIYLAGRAAEAMNQKDQAMGWYLRLRKTEPGYRDADDRLKQLYHVRD